MVTTDDLATSAEISAALINKATIEQIFSRRMNEQIRRAEASTIKKKLDTITLTIVIVLTLIVSILFILEIRFDIFINDTDKIYIPIILLCLLVIISVLLLAEFYFVKKKGVENINQKLGSLQIIEKKILELQKNNTKVYNFVKNAFSVVSTVDSKFLLNGFIIHFYVFLTEKEHEYSIEKLYRYLFLATTKKNILFKKIVKNIDEIEEVKSNIFIHLPNIEFLLSKFQEIEKLPNYFINSSLKSLEILNQFKVTKGDFIIKKGKIIEDKG